MADRRAIVITGAIVAAAGLAFWATPKRAPPAQTKELSAAVVNRLSTFSIRNADHFAWHDCDLDLNAAYSARLAYLASGADVEIQSAEFVKPDGSRFDWRATKPLRLRIYCRRAPTATGSTEVGWR